MFYKTNRSCITKNRKKQKMATRATKAASKTTTPNVVEEDDVPFCVGVFVKEVGPRSKGRNGVVTQVMKVYAWVKQSDGTFFKKMKKYLEITNDDEVAEDRFVDAPIEVGTLIECVGGTNCGAQGRVCAITRFFYRFEVQVEGQSKLKMVRKHYAKAIVDWKKASIGTQNSSVNKRRKGDPSVFNQII